MAKELFDYELVKPDRSEILIRRGYNENIGRFIWDYQRHTYGFLGEKKVSEDELKEIFESLKKLNLDTKLPKWLRWTQLR
jgi:hypothetical protein